MSEHECETCNDHSGMESRQTLVTWLIGILITMLIGIGGAQITMLQNLRSDVAVVQTRLAGMDNQYATGSRMSQVEQDVAVLKIVCGNPR